MLDVAVVADNGDLLGEAPDRMRGKNDLQHPSVPLHQLQNGGADLKRGDLHTPIGDHALNKGGDNVTLKNRTMISDPNVSLLF